MNGKPRTTEAPLVKGLSMPKKPPAPATAVYALKIALTDLEPQIWRSLEVRGDTTLAKLHP